MDKKKIYIGIVGQISCGKGVLKDFLVQRLGFASFSLSSIVHEELYNKGIQEVNREMLQNIGDDLRKKYGDAILAKRAIQRTNKQNDKKIVIEGIRNPGEIIFLKKIPGFVLIGVKAKRELRFKRLLARNKKWDPKTWSDFLVVDRRDLGVGQKKSGQQVGKCLAYCDYVLTNNNTIADFHRKVKALMEKLFKT